MCKASSKKSVEIIMVCSHVLSLLSSTIISCSVILINIVTIPVV